jgi:hypothetical protein
MERSEIAELIRMVNATYPNAKPITPIAEPIWVEDLGELEAVHVRAAFTAYRRAGHAFPPGSADLRRLVLELERAAVTFEQVWGEIHHAVRSFGWPRTAEALHSLTSVPFALDLVAAMGGWPAVCSAGPDDGRPTDPGVWRSQAEHAFRALVAQRRDDEAVAGLPGARAAAAGLRLAEAEAVPALPEPEVSPPSEPLRVIELPVAKTLGPPARPAIVLPPPGPAYRHGPTCVCERCMPAIVPSAEPAPTPSSQRSSRSTRRRGRHRSRR